MTQASKRLLGQLFGQTSLPVWLKNTTGVDQLLGAGAWKNLPSLDRKADGTTIQIFDQPFDAQGNVSIHAGYLGVGTAIDAFGDGIAQELLPGANPGVLDVAAGFGLNTHLSLHNQAGLQLTARAGLSGQFRYRHYQATPVTEEKLDALKALVGGSRLPNLLDLAKLPAEGEVHRLDVRLGLDLGLKFEAGYQAQTDITRELGDGMSLAFRTDVAAAVSAALGLSFFDDMVLAVGRAQQLEEGWLRIRLQRQNERKLSFGTTFSLDLGYDLGSSLEQLFEEAVGQLPIPRLVKTAATITRTLADGDWQTVKARLTTEMEEVLDDLVNEVLGLATDGEEKDWRQWLDTDPRIHKLTQFSSEAVQAYDGLDARVQSLWDRVLSKTDTGQGSKARAWLQQLVDLEGQNLELEDLLSDKDGRWIEAIEALTGKSLEDLVLEGQLQTSIKEASTLAQEALGVLDNTPGKVVQDMQAFAEKTGIRSTVDVLRKMTSTQDLKAEASSRLSNLAGKLVGKAAAQLTQADLKKISAWAAKIFRLLPDPNLGGTEAAALKERIAKRLRQLKVDYGFSVSFEIERVARSTALLDLELDPSDKHADFRRDIAEALKFGQARKLFTVLAAATGMIDHGKNNSGKAEKLPTPPFLVREAAFTSERIRSSAVSTVFKMIGLGQMLAGKESGFTRRVEQSTLRVFDRRATDSNAPASQRFHRQGRYTASFQRGDHTADLKTEAGIWLVCEDADQPSAQLRNLEDKFVGGQTKKSLRLSFSWEDSSAKEREITALTMLLSELGLQPVSADQTTPEAILEQGRAVRLAFEMRFSEDVVQQFLDGFGKKNSGDTWNRAYLAAAQRWLAEPYVTRDRLPGDATNTRNLGQILAQFITSKKFRNNSSSAAGFFQELGGKTVTVPFDDGAVSVEIGPVADPTPVTGLLHTLIARREDGHKAMRKRLAKQWQETLAQRSPPAYRQLTRTFADSWRRASVYTMLWPNSMFCIWMWLAGLNALDPKLLKSATGIATLRWRPGTSDTGNTASTTNDDTAPEWSEPLVWTLRPGVGVPDNFATGVFKDPS